MIKSLKSQQARHQFLAVLWTLTPVFFFLGLSCRLKYVWVISRQPPKVIRVKVSSEKEDKGEWLDSSASLKRFITKVNRTKLNSDRLLMGTVGAIKDLPLKI
jgi:hypothetical protein